MQGPRTVELLIWACTDLTISRIVILNRPCVID